MSSEEKHIRKYAHQRFFKNRAYEQLQDELYMLCEYVDEIAEHPNRTGFLKMFTSEKSPPGGEWGLLSTEQKIRCYREYIDCLNRNSRNSVLQPESTEWYDDWLTYCMADP